MKKAWSCNAFCRLRPRHQGGAHGGRAPAKIVRASAKITGLSDKKFGILRHFWYERIENDQMATLCSMEAGVDG